jgi:hypothetical protein
MLLAGGFTTQLNLADRRRLRLVIRNVHLKHYPTEHLTDYECDKLIDAWGPEVAAQQIRDAMTLGLVE